jgi:perosamine synthetase
MKVRIPLAKPEVTDDDRDAVLEVLRTPHLSMGPKLGEFERAICDYTGCKYAVAVNSGTSALHIAIRALGLKHGDEVILPSFTFSALLNVILQEGLQPKFVDIDPETYNVTSELVDAAITSRTRLVLAVHTFGFPVDVEAIRAASGELPVIEDACEALGAEVRDKKVGNLGDAGLFAFYPNKQITTGEGGVLVTSSEQIAFRARKLRNQGRDPDLDWLQHTDIGFSYRLSEINSALGISQLRRIEDVISRRQKIAETYDRELAGIIEVHRPPLTSAVGRISWFVYPIRLTKEFSRADRDWISQSMLRKGIATDRYFAPLHLQPVLRSSIKPGQFHLSETEFVADRIIALPFFNELTEKEIQEVCATLAESIGELRRKT